MADSDLVILKVESMRNDETMSVPSSNNRVGTNQFCSGCLTVNILQEHHQKDNCLITSPSSAFFVQDKIVTFGKAGIRDRPYCFSFLRNTTSDQRKKKNHSTSYVFCGVVFFYKRR